MFCTSDLREVDAPSEATHLKVFFDDGDSAICRADTEPQPHAYSMGWCTTCGVPRYDCREWDESKYERVPAGESGGGRFTSGSGGSASSDASPEITGAYARPDVVRVSNVEDAISLILKGQSVEVDDVTKVHTLIARLATIAADAKAKGEKAGNYDLCRVSVAGTNLFCVQRARTEEFPDGVPRLKMPQLSGQAEPGSLADRLPKGKDGSVNASDAFSQHLQAIGIGTTTSRVAASTLRASQRELIGTNVAGMMSARDFDVTKEPIFISRDNYVIDGHHRWAAAVGRDAEDGRLGDVAMNVVRIDAPISEVLHIANDWTRKFGLRAKGVSLRSVFSLFDESQPRDDNGRWTDGGGAASSAEASDAIEAIRASIVNDPKALPIEKKHALEIASAEYTVRERLKSGDTKSLHTKTIKRGTETVEVYTDERIKVHSQILTKFLDDTVKRNGGHPLPFNLEQPVATFMAGMPGSGKSTASGGVDFKDIVKIDSDLLKPYFPEYKRGTEAAVVARESADLADQLLSLATENRMNVWVDGVLKTTGNTDARHLGDGALGKMAYLKSHGYRIEMRYVDVPVNLSVARVVQRYIGDLNSNDPATQKSARYVPVSFPKGLADADYGTRPHRTFSLATKSTLGGDPLVSAWIHVNGETRKVIGSHGELQTSTKARKTRAA